ncbi:hypothetical protein [Agreia sp. Leaf210]|uniref:hypothetical protein n=1 Tax=Agreia sp. Leaf210 TaxID=1735682 RepID=UPI0012E2E671|nr:hypothetical protein [Agreia sp. Leaf210]
MFGQKRGSSVRRSLFAIGLVIVMLSAAGCTRAQGGSGPTTGSPIATQATSREEAETIATESYESFLAVSDEVGAQGGSDTTKLSQVSEGEALKEIVQNMSELSEAGLRITGATGLVYVEVADWDDSRIRAYICEDVGAVDLLDSQGNSLVSPDRLSITPFEVELKRSQDSLFLLSERKVWTGKNFCE